MQWTASKKLMHNSFHRQLWSIQSDYDSCSVILPSLSHTIRMIRSAPCGSSVTITKFSIQLTHQVYNLISSIGVHVSSRFLSKHYFSLIDTVDMQPIYFGSHTQCDTPQHQGNYKEKLYVCFKLVWPRLTYPYRFCYLH